MVNYRVNSFPTRGAQRSPLMQLGGNKMFQPAGPGSNPFTAPAQSAIAARPDRFVSPKETAQYDPRGMQSVLMDLMPMMPKTLEGWAGLFDAGDAGATPQSAPTSPTGWGNLLGALMRRGRGAAA